MRACIAGGAVVDCIPAVLAAFEAYGSGDGRTASLLTGVNSAFMDNKPIDTTARTRVLLRRRLNRLRPIERD